MLEGAVGTVEFRLPGGQVFELVSMEILRPRRFDLEDDAAAEERRSRFGRSSQ